MRPLLSVPVAALLLALVAWPSLGASQLDANGVPVPEQVAPSGSFHDSSLLSDLSGRWAGSGSATYTDGSSERLKCVVTYMPDPVGAHVRQMIRCRGDSMSLQLAGHWSIKDGAIAGTWQEDTYSLSGTLSGHSGPDGYRILAESTFADAKVDVHIVGCEQDIVMRFSQQVDTLQAVLRKC